MMTALQFMALPFELTRTFTLLLLLRSSERCPLWCGLQPPPPPSSQPRPAAGNRYELEIRLQSPLLWARTNHEQRALCSRYEVSHAPLNSNNRRQQVTMLRSVQHFYIMGNSDEKEDDPHLWRRYHTRCRRRQRKAKSGQLYIFLFFVDVSLCL